MVRIKSPYDNKSDNANKFFGRILRVQDNFYLLAILIALVAIPFAIYVIKSEKLFDLSKEINFWKNILK